jgi:hypothetical protein
MTRNLQDMEEDDLKALAQGLQAFTEVIKERGKECT